MKNYLKISIVLCLITLCCAAILAALNLVTAGVIEENDKKTKKETIKAIYDDFDHYTSESYDDLVSKYANVTIDSAINERITVYSAKEESANSLIGYIYSVAKRNAYGNISLMVAISKNNTVYQVEFLENGQSFASTVDSWVKSKFQSKGAKKYEAGFTTEVEAGKELSAEELALLDVKCTATYGATTVKELVTLALTTEEAI